MLWEKVRTVVVHIVHKQVWNRFDVLRDSTLIMMFLHRRTKTTSACTRRAYSFLTFKSGGKVLPDHLLD